MFATVTKQVGILQRHSATAPQRHSATAPQRHSATALTLPTFLRPNFPTRCLAAAVVGACGIDVARSVAEWKNNSRSKQRR